MKSDRRLELAIGLDVFFVVLFVAIGRRNHQESSAFSEVLRTAAPFLIGLTAAWLAARAWKRPERLATGLAVWPITVLVGMMVRNLVFDRGTDTAFVLVTTGFLGLCFMGWRAIVWAIDQRRPAPV